MFIQVVPGAVKNSILEGKGGVGEGGGVFLTTVGNLRLKGAGLRL